MNTRIPTLLLIAAFAASGNLPASAQQHGERPRPVERVLGQLQLSPEQRAQVSALLQQQRAEHRAADEAMRSRHEQELGALLNADQRVAVREAMRPPCPPPRETAPPQR